jgi:histone-lysine N-methyltransferase SETMAR
LDHPPYSPDFAPSDFHLFLHLKKHLVGKKFDDDGEVQEEVMTWIKGQAAAF